MQQAGWRWMTSVFRRPLGGSSLQKALALKQLSVAHRLWLGFGLVLSLFASATAFSVYQMGVIERDSAIAIRSHTEIGERAQVMRNSVDELFTSVVLLGIATYKDDVQYHVEAIDRSMANYRKARRELIASTNEGADVPGFKQLRRQLEDAEVVMGTVAELVRQQHGKAASLQEGMELELNLSLVTQLSSNMKNEFDFWGKSMSDVLTATRLLSQQRQRRVEMRAALARRVVLVATMLALSLGIFAAWHIARSVGGPIRQAVDAAEEIARGNLTVEFPAGRGDEVGTLMEALMRMQENLRCLVAEVRDAATSIEEASKEVASGNLDLSRRTEHTVNRLQSTTASMSKLSGAVHRSVNAASGADTLARLTAEEAQQGGRVVIQVVDNMRQISAKSLRISEIIGVIDSIAFQTNILALNAAVEAARAGEQGRGFVVVANEVRGLAKRTADAAKDVKELITETVQSIESGEGLVEEAGTRIEQLMGAAGNVTATMSQILLSMEEQRSGLDRVQQAVSDVDQLTQQNAALVEQSAAAAESLQNQALRLSRAVAAFRITIAR